MTNSQNFEQLKQLFREAIMDLVEDEQLEDSLTPENVNDITNFIKGLTDKAEELGISVDPELKDVETKTEAVELTEGFMSWLRKKKEVLFGLFALVAVLTDMKYRDATSTKNIFQVQSVEESPLSGTVTAKIAIGNNFLNRIYNDENFFDVKYFKPEGTRIVKDLLDNYCPGCKLQVVEKPDSDILDCSVFNHKGFGAYFTMNKNILEGKSVKEFLIDKGYITADDIRKITPLEDQDFDADKYFGLQSAKPVSMSDEPEAPVPPAEVNSDDVGI